eukprot:PRCOL_00005244-RA
MVAASLGDEAMVRTLLTHGARADRAHPWARTSPLHFAAEVGAAGVVAALCEAGARADARKANGATPLHAAADANKPAAIRQLLSGDATDRTHAAACVGASVDALVQGDTTALYLASQRGHVEAVRELLRLGAAPDFAMPKRPRGWNKQRERERLRSQGNGGGSALAETDGWEAVLEYDPMSRVPAEVGNGAAALHAACENGHVDVALALIDGGADIETRSMGGVTPLVLAVQYRRAGVVEALLGRGADASARWRGLSALAYALEDADAARAERVASLLLAHGAPAEDGGARAMARRARNARGEELLARAASDARRAREARVARGAEAEAARDEL